MLGPQPASAANFFALFNAIAQNNIHLTKQLTPGNATINTIDKSSGATPLTWACMRRVDPRIAAWLISKGADLNKMDGEGETPLTTAISYGNVGVVMLLLTMGASPHIPNNQGLPPVILACGQHGSLPMIRALIAHGVQIQGELGQAVLRQARAHKKADIVQFLTSNSIRPGYFEMVKKLYQ